MNIYRFVTKGTIEEDILKRAKEKLVLDHVVIQRMDTSGKNLEGKASTFSGKKSFTTEELTKILKFGAQDIFAKSDTAEKELHELHIDDILERAEKANTDDQRSFYSNLIFKKSPHIPFF